MTFVIFLSFWVILSQPGWFLCGYRSFCDRRDFNFDIRGSRGTRESKTSMKRDPQIDSKKSHDQNTPSVPHDDPEESRSENTGGEDK